MKTLKQIWLVARILVSIPVAVVISPFGRWALLFLSLFAVIGFVLVSRAGLSVGRLLWYLPLVLVGSAVLGWRAASRSVKGHSLGPEVYDKAKYHYDGDFPKGLPERQAFVHTGMFVGWLIDHDMIAPDFREETRGFKERQATGAQVYEAWDGCLNSDMLTEEGNRFAADYFHFERGQFLADYDAVLVKDLPSEYHVADTWANYELMKQKVDQRYAAWKQGKQRAT